MLNGTTPFVIAQIKETFEKYSQNDLKNNYQFSNN